MRGPFDASADAGTPLYFGSMALLLTPIIHMHTHPQHGNGAGAYRGGDYRTNALHCPKR